MLNKEQRIILREGSTFFLVKIILQSHVNDLLKCLYTKM
jgi:hypothetical protein